MILNLTQHPASEAQKEEGVVDLTGPELQELKELLTFRELPTKKVVWWRAKRIATLAHRGTRGVVEGGSAMVGGAPYLMEPLVIALREESITPVFAFSERQSVEVTLPDGSTRKSQIFRHLGFVGAD